MGYRISLVCRMACNKAKMKNEPVRILMKVRFIRFHNPNGYIDALIVLTVFFE
jgi:hypothetical protein